MATAVIVIEGVTAGANATGSAAQGVKTAAEELSRRKAARRSQRLPGQDPRCVRPPIDQG